MTKAQGDADLKQVVIDSIKDTLRGFQQPPQMGASEYLPQERDSSSTDLTRALDTVDGLQRQMNEVKQRPRGLTGGARFSGVPAGRRNTYFQGSRRGSTQQGDSFYQFNRPPRFNSFPNRSTRKNLGEVICSSCRRVGHFARNCPSSPDPGLPSSFPRATSRFNWNSQSGTGNRPVRKAGPTPFYGF